MSFAFDQADELSAACKRIAELEARLAKYERAIERVREVESLPAVTWRLALRAAMHDLDAALRGEP